MTDSSESPNVEELQAKIVQYEKEKAEFVKKQTEFDAIKIQYEELQKKYESSVKTNMDLIQMIPKSGGNQHEENKPKADLNQMTGEERYNYLKALAVKSYEKTETK